MTNKYGRFPNDTQVNNRRQISLSRIISMKKFSQALNLLITCIVIQSFIFSETKAQCVFIPDSLFRSALVSNPLINLNADNEIQQSEAAQFNGAIYLNTIGITDLTGLQAFTHLRIFNCNNVVSISSIDLSLLPNLEELYCNNNFLSQLIFPSNSKLKVIDCSSSSLPSLDVSTLASLRELYLDYNANFSEIDISNNDSLETLTCYNSNISQIHFGNNFMLRELICAANEISSLDLSNLPMLERLDCSGNLDISSLDLSNNMHLSALDCSFTSITNMNVNNLPELSALVCTNNGLSSIQTSQNLLLTYLNCSNNNISTLQVGGNSLLTELNCSNNPLTSIDVSQNTSLLRLNCSHINAITSLNLTANTLLRELDASYCHLANINLTSNPLLEKINISSNLFTTFNPSSFSNLKELRCADNKITTLNLTANYYLEQLDCSSNYLYYLNIQNGNNQLFASTLNQINAQMNPMLSCILVDNPAQSTFNILIDQEASISNNCTVNFTRLRNVDCNKTSLLPNSQIACIPIFGATNYEFEFRDLNTNLYGTKVTTNVYFVPGLLMPNLQWSTQYYCRVRAKVGGVWGDYGQPCVIGMAANPTLTTTPNTKLESKWCNKSNISSTATISCVQITMGSLYSFEFTDSATSVVITKTSPIKYLKLSSLSPSIVAGHTYYVRVKALRYQVWGNYSDLCYLRIAGPSTNRVGLELTEEDREETAEEEFYQEELPTFELSIFPNPTDENSRIRVVSMSQHHTLQIAVYDLSGKQVYTNTFVGNADISCNELSLTKGVYLVSVNSEHGATSYSKMVVNE